MQQPDGYRDLGNSWQPKKLTKNLTGAIKKMPNSKRVQTFWTRLKQWYGQRIVDAYGEEAPPDWARIIDYADNSQLKSALEKLKSIAPVHPPTFPQFEQAIKNVTAFSAPARRDIVEELGNFVLRRHHQGIAPLTNYQIAGIPPWTYIGKEFDAPDLAGVMKKNHGVDFVGVIIPSDGDHPGYRVMVEDMNLE
jgi:hypothetical protein